MSFRGIYDNSYNRNRTRMDARTGEAKQFGIRNTHRNGRGEVIGGVNAAGQAFGTKARNTGSGFRQRGPQLMANMPPTVPAVRPASAPAKAYMAEPVVMRRPAPAGSAPYPTAATAKPALPESALSPQLTSNTAGLATKRDAAGNRINPLTGKPFGGGAPVTSGKQVASMGLKGAIADYQKRSEAAKSAKF